jgi:hypothetical protein
MRKKGYKARSIQIPEWMNSAVTDLAIKHKRSVNAEIEYLVESGLQQADLAPAPEGNVEGEEQNG